MRSSGNAPETPDDGVSAGQRRDATEKQLTRLAHLIAASPHNLISRGERARVRDVHIAEAEAVGALIDPRPGTRWLDLGTGGGLPGLVLAILFPETHWTLVDATAKKVQAVAGFVSALGLVNVEAVEGRAEDLARTARHRGRYAGLTSRAVAALPTLLELARGFLAPGGLLVAIKGPRWQEERRQADVAMQTLHFEDAAVTVVDTAVRPTWVVTMRAVGGPPAGYPRRTGVPKAQPLGALRP